MMGNDLKDGREYRKDTCVPWSLREALRKGMFGLPVARGFQVKWK